MKMHFKVYVEVGSRTKTYVSAYSTAVNKKTAKFANGVKVSDKRIAEWLEEALMDALKKLENSGETK